MCVENSNNITMEYNINKNKKISYILKKALKTVFKIQKAKKVNLICKQSSLESLENAHNAEVEMQIENEANERIYAASSYGSGINSEEQYDEAAVYVPVHFARTQHGTFFWTASTSTPADMDLIEPLYCCTDNQIAVPQHNDRWVQA